MKIREYAAWHPGHAGRGQPLEKAQRLNHWVFQNIREKNFGVGFAAASEVARNLTGDCSEHAVLLAALRRACDIPARVVVGLVYVEKHQGFGYHMWDEVYIDPALRSRLIRPGTSRPSMPATSSSPNRAWRASLHSEAFLPILKVSGKLQIEPIELHSRARCTQHVAADPMIATV